MLPCATNQNFSRMDWRLRLQACSRTCAITSVHRFLNHREAGRPIEDSTQLALAMSTHSSMSSVQQLTHHELAALLAEAKPPLVIDVLTEEDYQSAHIQGAKNACVFNVSFLDDIKRLVPDQSTHIVVYGASARDLA